VGECGEEKYYMSDVSDRIRVDPDVQMVYGKKRTLKGPKCKKIKIMRIPAR